MGSPLPGALFTRCSSKAVVVAGRPASINASLAVVPPMSNAMRSRWPVSSPYAAAIRAPAAGPDSIIRTG